MVSPGRWAIIVWMAAVSSATILRIAPAESADTSPRGMFPMVVTTRSRNRWRSRASAMCVTPRPSE